MAANVASGAVIANTATALLVPSSVVQRDASNNFAAGTITATLNGNATNVTGIVAPANGGTGINNGVSTITTQGNLSHLGAFTQTIRAFVNSDVTLPQSGILFSDRANSITSATVAGVLTNETGFNVGALAVFSDGPAFTGAPTAPTAAASTNNTQIATTAYADGAVATLGATKQNTLTNSAGLAGALSDETGSVGGGLAVFSISPALTGTPIAPTAGNGTNTTQIATTAFVLANTGITKFTNVPGTTPPLIDGGAEAEVEYPASGALTTGTAVVSPVGVPDAGLGIVSSRISAAGVVRVRYRNFTGGGLTPSVNLNISVIQ